MKATESNDTENQILEELDLSILDKNDGRCSPGDCSPVNHCYPDDDD